MCRHFGTTRSPGPHGSDVVSVLRDTRCIFISHIHGDHQMGLARILAKRRTVRAIFHPGSKPTDSYRTQLDPPPDTPLYLIANRATHLYLQEYQDLQDLGFDNSMSGVRRIIADEIEWRKSGIDETWSDHESSGSWNGERGERTR